jgi:hypothetical protein
VSHSSDEIRARGRSRGDAGYSVAQRRKNRQLLHEELQAYYEQRRKAFSFDTEWTTRTEEALETLLSDNGVTLGGKAPKLDTA